MSGVSGACYIQEYGFKDYWPPLQVTDPSEPNWPVGSLTEKVELVAAPLVSAWYPNYNSDYAICICPSDAEDSVDGLKNEAGDWDVYYEPWKAAFSYAYFIWMLDRLNDPALPPVDINVYTNIFAVSAALDLNVPEEGLVTQQFGEMCNSLLGNIVNRITDTPGGVVLLELAAMDVKVPVGMGNGGDTTYRLKEGNERFMITDVNNPQTAAMAQSTIFAMMDTFGSLSGIKYFNHVPGGCNVLFMDGHVDWVPMYPRLPERATRPKWTWAPPSPCCRAWPPSSAYSTARTHPDPLRQPFGTGSVAAPARRSGRPAGLPPQLCLGALYPCKPWLFAPAGASATAK